MQLNVDQLNEIADNYQFFIDDRSYIHSSNFAVCLSECLKDSTVTIRLTSHHPIINGFKFVSNDTEDKLATISIDDSILYVIGSDTLPSRKSNDELTDSHRIIIKIQEVLKHLCNISMSSSMNYTWWSYVVEWNLKVILKAQVNDYQFKFVRNQNRIKKIHVYFDNELAWIQDGIRK